MQAHEIVIAGFGGQGVLFLGEVLAHAAIHEGLHVTWLPSYGPEMRGGTASCTVVVSDEPVASPVVADPTILIALNRPSLERFERAVRPGGLIVTDSTMIERDPERGDVDVVTVPATTIANDLGATRAANVVMLGALLSVRALFADASITAALEEKVRKPEARAINTAALERGRREARRAGSAVVAP